jgi:predicted transcriptional regulator
MNLSADVHNVLTLASDRIDVLDFLEGDRVQKRTIVDELGYSRSTVNRVITELADAGLVDDSPRGCRTTFVGTLVADRYREYVADSTHVVNGREVLAPLPPGSDLSPAVLADAKVAVAGGSSPYEPYYAVEEVLKRPGPDGQVRMYVPAFTNPHGLELARAMAAESSVEAVFTDELLAELHDDFPEELDALFELEKFAGYRTTAGPEYTLVVADSESGTDIVVVTHTQERTLGGVIINGHEDAVSWAEQRYAEIRAAGERLDGYPG